jgi:hypothetical protein
MPLSPSLGNLNALMASFNAAAGTAVYDFLDSSNDSIKWSTMSALINLWVSSNSLSATELRVVITLSDGTVAYDTSKANANTYEKYVAKTINENHNSRVSILQALLGSSGIGFETKYSTTSTHLTNYFSQRVGPSVADALGVIRVSVLET